ncbi:hypothetical protein V8E53_014271 [Lactarius tabidus]
MGISLLKAQLISLCLSTFLYGMFLALVLMTTIVMVYKATDDTRRQRVKVLPVSYAMLAVATMHFIVGWVQGVDAFIDQKGGSATAFYADISDPTSLLRQSCLCLQSVMGDAIIMWRMYIVYGRRFKVIIPTIILVIAYAVIGIYVLAITKSVRPGTDIFHVSTTLITVYFSLTMATNVILTGAIASRILLAGNPLHGSRPHWLIIFTLVESCALYTFNVVAALATFLSGSFGQYAAVNSIVPVVGISFSLIVLQIRFHVTPMHGPRSHSSGTVWPKQGSRPAGGEDPNYIRMTVRMSNKANPPHSAGGKDGSALDIDKPIPV